MTDEEKDLKYLSAMRVIDFNKLGFVCGKETITNVLNLIQKQNKAIEKLKKNNKELLRKLRNRVKEVKKLIKYSSYKKEFANLNKKIQIQDKIISEMAIFINNLDIDEDICKEQEEKFCKDMYEVSFDICKKCIINYFEKKEGE